MKRIDVQTLMVAKAPGDGAVSVTIIDIAANMFEKSNENDEKGSEETCTRSM